MKFVLLATAITVLNTVTASACPWAGGSFRGEEADFQTYFTVNADCTEMSFESSGNDGIQAQDVAQNFALATADHGWVADINGVDATLAKGGYFVDFIGEGLNTRVHMKPD